MTAHVGMRVFSTPRSLMRHVVPPSGDGHALLVNDEFPDLDLLHRHLTRAVRRDVRHAATAPTGHADTQ